MTSSTRENLDELRHAAQTAQWAGDFRRALKLRLRLHRRLIQTPESTEARILNLQHLTVLAVHTGELELAEISAEEALRLCAAPYDSHMSTCLMNVACVLAERRKFDEASNYGRQAVERFESALGTNCGFVRDRKADLRRMDASDETPYFDLP